MAIELQNTPPGNHRVAGSHRQGGKAADAGQAGNALGFAALMSLVSDEESGSDAVAESDGLALMPAGVDGISPSLLVFAPASHCRSNGNVATGRFCTMCCEVKKRMS